MKSMMRKPFRISLLALAVAGVAGPQSSFAAATSAAVGESWIITVNTDGNEGDWFAVVDDSDPNFPTTNTPTPYTALQVDQDLTWLNSAQTDISGAIVNSGGANGGAVYVDDALTVTGATTLQGTLDAWGSISNTSGNNSGVVRVDDALAVYGDVAVVGNVGAVDIVALGNANLGSLQVDSVNINDTTVEITTTPGTPGRFRVTDTGSDSAVSVFGPGDAGTDNSPYYPGEVRPAMYVASNGATVTDADTEYMALSHDMLYLGSVGDFLPSWGTPADTSTTVITRGGAVFNSMTGGVTTINGAVATFGSSTVTIDGDAETITGGDNATQLAVSDPNGVTVTGGATTLTLDDTGAHLDGPLDMGGNQINNLDDGELPDDAATYGQLTGAVTTLDTRLNDLEGDMSGGIASALALSSIQMPSAPGKTAVSAGYGHYNGENAMGLNLVHAPAGWAANRGTIGIGVGFGSDGSGAYKAHAGFEF